MRRLTSPHVLEYARKNFGWWNPIAALTSIIHSPVVQEMAANFWGSENDKISLHFESDKVRMEEEGYASGKEEIIDVRSFGFPDHIIEMFSIRQGRILGKNYKDKIISQKQLDDLFLDPVNAYGLVMGKSLDTHRTRLYHYGKLGQAASDIAEKEGIVLQASHFEPEKFRKSCYRLAYGEDIHRALNVVDPCATVTMRNAEARKAFRDMMAQEIPEMAFPKSGLELANKYCNVYRNIVIGMFKD